MIIIPCAITLIGIGWSPKIRKLQIDHDLAYVWSDTSDQALEQQKLPKAHRVRYFRGDSTKTKKSVDFSDAASTVSTKYSKTQKKKSNIKDDAKKVVVQTNTSRGKATLINCMIKIVAIPVFMAFFTYIFETADVTNIHHGFFYITANKTLFGMFIVHIITSFVGYHFAWMGCMITLQRLCFAIPLTFATPICIVIVLTKSCSSLALSECPASLYNQHGFVVALLSVALWLGQFFATTYYAWKSQDFVMAEEATLFWVPTWDGKILHNNYPFFINQSSTFCTKLIFKADSFLINIHSFSSF